MIEAVVLGLGINCETGVDNSCTPRRSLLPLHGGPGPSMLPGWTRRLHNTGDPAEQLWLPQEPSSGISCSGSSCLSPSLFPRPKYPSTHLRLLVLCLLPLLKHQLHCWLAMKFFLRIISTTFMSHETSAHGPYIQITPAWTYLGEKDVHYLRNTLIIVSLTPSRLNSPTLERWFLKEMWVGIHLAKKKGGGQGQVFFFFSSSLNPNHWRQS